MNFIRSVGHSWRAFWFPAIPVPRLAMFRILVAAYVLWDILFESRWMLRYASVAQEFYDPIFVMRALGLPRLGPEGLGTVRLLLIIASLLALVGLCTRLALWIAASLYLFWFATYYSYQWVYDPKIATTFALFVLAVAPSGRAYSIDALIARRRNHRSPAVESSELAGWAFQVLTVLLFCIYGFAAFNKLRFSGPDWWTSGAFEYAISYLGTPPARYLAEHHPGLVDGLALSVLVFEICAPVLLFRTPLRKLYAGFAILFHLGTLALLNLSFLDYAVVCAVVFDLERIPAVLGQSLRSSYNSLGLPGSTRYLALEKQRRGVEMPVEESSMPAARDGKRSKARRTGLGAAVVVGALAAGLLLAGRNASAAPGTDPAGAEEAVSGGLEETISSKAPESPQPDTDPPTSASAKGVDPD